MKQTNENLEALAQLRKAQDEITTKGLPDAASLDDVMPDITKTIHDMQARQNEKQQRLREFLSTLPQTQACSIHQKPAELSFDKSWETTCDFTKKSIHTGPKCGEFFAEYVCPQCETERQAPKLKRLRLPRKYWTATLDDLTYDSQRCRDHLAECLKFQGSPRGFLVLLGEKGNGKTHIAASIIRKHGGIFMTQSELIAAHRATYRSPEAEDVRSLCMKTPLLALDEIGVATGGNDAMTLVFDVVDARYANQLPTIITSNLCGDKLRDALGDRLHDRLKEAAFAVLRFDEPSKRGSASDAYFDEA